MWFTFKHIFALIAALWIGFASGQTLYEGSICTFQGQAGVCKVITQCPSILADVTARRIAYNDMVSCGFKGRDPVICCPGEISDRAGEVSSTTTEEIFTFDSRGSRRLETTTPTKAIVTSNNVTIPSTLPFIDLTKLLSERKQTESNNRIEESSRDLKDDAGWIRTPMSQAQNAKIEYIGDVNPFELNNLLDSDEGSTDKPAINPNDPFEIYSFREYDETDRVPNIRTTTFRTTRQVPRGFTTRFPSNRWVWGTDCTTPRPFNFPSNSGSSRTSSSTTTTPRSLPMRELGSRAKTACTNYSKDVAAPIDFQILGGVPASPGEFPHMAAFGYNDVNGIAWNCAGSLISERYVLTAAHCVSRQTNLPNVIRLGKTSLDTSDDGADIVDTTIEKIILHPNYVASQNYHDIALIRIARDAPLGNFIRPACLYTDEKDNSPSTTLVATGWGTVNPDTRAKSNILLKVNLTIVDLGSCNQTHVSIGLDRRLRNGLNEGQMCAFYANKDTCEGDSGGPLQVMDEYSVSTVVGITSFGLSCGSNVPSVYARVAYYLDWIENTVWPL